MSSSLVPTCRKYPESHTQPRHLAAALYGGPAPPDRRWEDATRQDDAKTRDDGKTREGRRGRAVVHHPFFRETTTRSGGKGIFRGIQSDTDGVRLVQYVRGMYRCTLRYGGNFHSGGEGGKTCQIYSTHPTGQRRTCSRQRGATGGEGRGDDGTASQVRGGYRGTVVYVRYAPNWPFCRRRPVATCWSGPQSVGIIGRESRAGAEMRRGVDPSRQPPSLSTTDRLETSQGFPYVGCPSSGIE
jgi:hypothetical protein